MKRVLFLLLLAAWVEIFAAEAGTRAIEWAQAEINAARESVSSAEKRVEAAQSDLRIAKEMQNDTQILKDPDAAAVAREAVTVSLQGLREAEILLERSKALVRHKERLLASVRETVSSAKDAKGILIPLGGEVRRTLNGAASVSDTCTPLRAGERVDVGSGASAKLFIGRGDGEIDLGENSSFSISSEGEEGLEAMLSQGFAHVRAKLKHYFGRKFEVRTPAAVCAVRGTEFTLRHHLHGSRLEVLEGTVTVRSSLKDEWVEVHGGEWCEILTPEGIQPVKKLSELRNGNDDSH